MPQTPHVETHFTSSETNPRHRRVESAKSLKFANDSAFQLELRRRVDEFFLATGRRQRDCWQMYLKTAIFLAGFAVSYCSWSSWPRPGGRACPWRFLLGLSAAGIGFNIQHDGGHQAYSNRPWVNKLMAMTLELIGGSSYLWRWKHVVIHHTYVNITGHDTDIDLGSLGRLTPHQRAARAITGGSTSTCGRCTGCWRSSGSSSMTSES